MRKPSLTACKGLKWGQVEASESYAVTEGVQQGASSLETVISSKSQLFRVKQIHVT